MTAGVLLLLTLSDALAFDVLKTDALIPHVEEVAARSGTTVVVAAAGGAADATLKRLARAAPAAPLTLARVSLTGDADEDMTKLLDRLGKPCGLRVSPGGIEGEWIVSEHGACGGNAVPVPEGWIDPAGSGARAANPEDAPTGEIVAPIPVAPALTVAGPIRPTLDPARLLLLDHTVPDPTTALLMSAIVGFGSGEFYARRPRAGWIHAGVQGTSLAIAAAAHLAERSALTSTGHDVARAISGLALTVSVGARLVEVATSPGDAATEAGRQIERELR